MDFTPVPAGTLAPAALVLRGSDHEVQFQSADSFHTVTSTTLYARDGPVANSKLARYSRVGGLLAGYFFTSDPGVIHALLHRKVVGPIKLRALWLRLVHDGLPDDAALDSREFHAAAESIVTGLDFSALDPAYLLLAGDLRDTQVSAHAAAATVWLRSGQFISLCEPVTGVVDLYRLTHLGAFYHFTPGLFLAVSRDNAGMHFRLLMEACRRGGDPVRRAHVGHAPRHSSGGARHFRCFGSHAWLDNGTSPTVRSTRCRARHGPFRSACPQLVGLGRQHFK